MADASWLDKDEALWRALRQNKSDCKVTCGHESSDKVVNMLVPGLSSLFEIALCAEAARAAVVIHVSVAGLGGFPVKAPSQSSSSQLLALLLLLSLSRPVPLQHPRRAVLAFPLSAAAPSLLFLIHHSLCLPCLPPALLLFA